MVQTSTVEEQIVAWLDSMNITATRDDSGIYYYSEVENPSGADVVQESVVAIYYTLQDLDSNIIASHQRVNGDSLIFKHGVSAVYPIGLDMAVSVMKVGETYHFLLPPDQAYEGLTSGAINPKSIILLTLEVVSVENESDIYIREVSAIDDYIDNNYLDSLEINPVDSTVFFAVSGIRTKKLREGIGSAPINGDTIILDYTSYKLDSTNIEITSGFQFYYGSNEPQPLIPGFEFGVSMMQTNERSLIMLPSSQAYRESALVIPASIVQDLINDAIIPDYVAKVAPYTTLLFEVTRVD